MVRVSGCHLVTMAWSSQVGPSVSGPPRRYYEITEAGQSVLREWAAAWRATRDSVDTVLEGTP